MKRPIPPKTYLIIWMKCYEQIVKTKVVELDEPVISKPVAPPYFF